MPSGWLSRADSRWAGSTAGLPAAVASWIAAPIASWLRRVKRLASMGKASPGSSALSRVNALTFRVHTVHQAQRVKS
jgi:hypothetical protein